jgi:hypothetical protein
MGKARKLLTFMVLIVVSCGGSLLGQITPGGVRVLAAEGDFVAQTKQGVQPISHWKLWRLGDGGYEVVDQKAQNASSVETFQFDAQLMPTGFTKRVGGVPQAKGGPSSRGVTISCKYMPRELTCTAESEEGKKASTSVAAKAPSVIMGEFYDLNFAWFMTGVVNLATRSNNENGLVNVYVLTDGPTSDEIALEADEPIKIIPAGQEDGQFDGKQQMLRKFEWDKQESLSILRTNAKSMVISLSLRESPNIGLAVINYKEYVSWEPKR